MLHPCIQGAGITPAQSSSYPRSAFLLSLSWSPSQIGSFQENGSHETIVYVLVAHRQPATGRSKRLLHGRIHVLTAAGPIPTTSSPPRPVIAGSATDAADSPHRLVPKSKPASTSAAPAMRHNDERPPESPGIIPDGPGSIESDYFSSLRVRPSDSYPLHRPCCSPYGPLRTFR